MPQRKKCGSGAFRGLKNHVMSTFHTVGWPFSAFGVVQKFHFAVAGGPQTSPAPPMNDAPAARDATPARCLLSSVYTVSQKKQDT